MPIIFVKHNWNTIWTGSLPRSQFPNSKFNFILSKRFSKAMFRVLTYRYNRGLIKIDKPSCSKVNKWLKWLNRWIPSSCSLEVHVPSGFCTVEMWFFCLIWVVILWKYVVFLSPKFNHCILDLWCQYIYYCSKAWSNFS